MGLRETESRSGSSVAKNGGFPQVFAERGGTFGTKESNAEPDLELVVR